MSPLGVYLVYSDPMAQENQLYDILGQYLEGGDIGASEALDRDPCNLVAHRYGPPKRPEWETYHVPRVKAAFDLGRGT